MKIKIKYCQGPIREMKLAQKLHVMNKVLGTRCKIKAGNILTMAQNTSSLLCFFASHGDPLV